MTEKNKKIIIPIIVVSLYLVYFYFFVAVSWRNGWLISRKDVNADNLKWALLADFLTSLLIVLVILFTTSVQEKSLKKLGLTLKSPFIVMALMGTYLIMFI